MKMPIITHDNKVLSVLENRLDILNKDKKVIGYLYLVIDLTEEKTLDISLKVMDQVEDEFLAETPLELTPEIKKYLVKDIHKDQRIPCKYF